MRVDRVFVDTNVLVYAHNADADNKHLVAKQRLLHLWESGKGVLSIQVLQELYVTLTRKLPKPLDRATAREIVRNYAPWLCDPASAELLLRASEIEELHRLSFGDALILAAAHQAGATILLSEDLSDGQIVEGVKIENPFRSTGSK